MSYSLLVLKDHPVGFWPLDESSGTTATDLSGCGNNGTYYGGLTTNILPLVQSGVSGSTINSTKYITLPITKDYTGQSATGHIANQYSSDKYFTLEIWFYPNISSSDPTPIFADVSNDIGIYWEKGNIVFKLQNTRLDYTVPYTKQAMHIVARYMDDYITLHINSRQVMSKELDDFKFTNSSASFQIGPTSSGDSFIVDAPAIYRYALNQQKIESHFFSSNGINPIQIAHPDQGRLFTLSDKNLKKSFSYVLPYQRSFANYESDDIKYDPNGNFLHVDKTTSSGTKTVIIEDSFTIPVGMVSSKVEWHGENGIKVYVKPYGGTYAECTNGGTIPKFRLGDFSGYQTVYYKIEISSTDTSKFNPKLEYLGFYFYAEKNIYSDNSGDYVSVQQPTGLSVSHWDFDIGSDNWRTLSRHQENGIRALNAGFAINTKLAVRTVEMFFTPINLNANYLLSAGAVEFSWNSSGAISKSNISAIYVNGIDRTSATNISSFLTAGEPHHIVLVLGQSVSDQLWFNVRVNSGTWSNPGPNNLYKNMAIYEKVFSLSEALTHFDLYTERPYNTVDNSVITVTEKAVEYHNNDWRVVKSR